MQLSGFHLLNILAAFDHQQTNPEDERKIIYRFRGMVVEKAAKA